MSEGFSAEPCFYEPEAFCSHSFLHLGEVGFGGCLVTVSAGFSEASFSSEAFHQVFDVWYLFELSDHEGSGVYWTGLPGPSVCRSFQRMCWIGVKSRFSNKSLGEPVSFI